MRTVLTVDPADVPGAAGLRQLYVAVDRAPVTIVAKRGGMIQFDVSQFADWAQPDAVLLRGRLLRDLLAQHPAVAELFPHLWAVPQGAVRPIFIKLTQGAAEAVTWESLCSASDEFVALNPRSPIGRVTDPVNAPPRPPAALRLPIRVMAIISALHVPGQDREWTLLRDACAAAHAGGLPVELHVMVGNAALRQAIIAEGAPWIQASMVGATGPQVLQAVQAFRPHVLHVFCHGAATATGQHLELATAGDYHDPGTSSGSVRIKAHALADASAALPNPLLLVLNCCSGGAPVDELTSMVHQAVSAGFRAGVAMREPVDAADAHEFTRALYPALFGQLQRVSEELRTAPSVLFEWATVMSDARAALCALHGDAPSSQREWIQPLLYVRGLDPMDFIRGEPTASEQDTADYRWVASLLARWLREGGRRLTEERRRAMMETMLADVPPRYWPNLDGTFPDA